MVLPEGAPDSHRSPKRSRSVQFGIAALALAFGAIALGALTAPLPEAASETTTTTTTDDIEAPIDFENFTIAEIARGTPLTWSQVHSVSDAYPLALFEHDGWTYLFATDVPNFSRHDSGGLRAWRSEDGVDWEALGQVIDQSRSIVNVSGTSQELVAVEAGSMGEDMTLWRSGNGIEWSPETIVIDALTESTMLYPYAIGGNERITAVAVRQGVDVLRLIQENLTGVFGNDVSPATSFGWEATFENDEVEFVLWGPLGFPLAEIPASDLGLTEEEIEAIESEYLGSGPPTGVDIWISTEGGDWLKSELPDAAWVTSITTTSSGVLLATGWGTQTNRLWTSLDGLNWQERDLGLGPERIGSWNGLLIGPSRLGTASVVASEDGLDWESVGLEEHFPPRISWGIGAFAAGAGGIVATVDGWTNSTTMTPEEAVVIRDGDATLTIYHSTGSYTLEKGDFTGTWSMSSSRAPDDVKVDPTSERLTFYDIETGAEVASFSFSELIEAEDAFWSTQGLEGHVQALAFTPDMEEWTIQDARSSLEDSNVVNLEVTDSQIVAATVSSGGRFYPQSSPGFEIWTTPVP